MDGMSRMKHYKMLGSYRYFLAMCVVISHTGPAEQVHLGFYGVIAFFILSGFLLCRSLRTHYFHSKGGVTTYVINRALRVYPLYMMLATMMLCALTLLPQNPDIVHHKLGQPTILYEWITNIVIIGNTSLLGIRAEHFLIPASWSLSVELLFWLFMILLCRKRLYIRYWCILSIALYLLLIMTGASLYLTYYSIFAGSCAFSIGAWAALHHEDNHIKTYNKKRGIYLACALVFYLISTCFYIDAPSREPILLSLGLPVSMLICYMIITSLWTLNAETLPSIVTTIDRMLGDMSYPIFISHIFVLYLMVYFNVIDADQQKTWTCFFMNITLTTLLSIILVYVFEKPIERIRLQMKLKNQRTTS